MHLLSHLSHELTIRVFAFPKELNNGRTGIVPPWIFQILCKHPQDQNCTKICGFCTLTASRLIHMWQILHIANCAKLTSSHLNYLRGVYDLRDNLWF